MKSFGVSVIMCNKRTAIAACLLAVLALAVAPAFGASSGDKVKNKGVITLRTGDTLTVKTSEGDFAVTFNSDTKIQHPVWTHGNAQKAGLAGRPDSWTQDKFRVNSW